MGNIKCTAERIKYSAEMINHYDIYKIGKKVSFIQKHKKIISDDFNYGTCRFYINESKLRYLIRDKYYDIWFNRDVYDSDAGWDMGYSPNYPRLLYIADKEGLYKELCNVSLILWYINEGNKQNKKFKYPNINDILKYFYYIYTRLLKEKEEISKTVLIKTVINYLNELPIEARLTKIEKLEYNN